jgi:hypothetical protein
LKTPMAGSFSRQRPGLSNTLLLAEYRGQLRGQNADVP